MNQSAKFTPPNEPAQYLPFYGRRYDTKPNLYRLGHDFENGRQDQNVLQIDNQAAKYRQLKLRNRRVDFNKYYCNELSQAGTESSSINKFLITILLTEHPQYFQAAVDQGETKLSCLLTGDQLRFDSEYILKDYTTKDDNLAVQYQSGLDALANQIQEDICVVKITGELDRLVVAHLSFPNQWSPVDKIGKSFACIHRPVARFTEQNTKPRSLVRALTRGGPYVRFAWGLSSDDELDHHPDFGKTVQFKVDQDPLYVRSERQTLVFLENTGLLLFFIRTYYSDCREVCQDIDKRRALLASIRSMEQDTLIYKGIAQSRDRIVHWLEYGTVD